MQRKEHFQTHSMRPPSPWYQKQTKTTHKKRKLQANIVHGVLKARILKWFVIPFSSGPHSVRPLHHDPSILGDPGILVNMAWFSFIELDKAVVCVIRLASFLWLWFQCVYPLMPSCNTYCLTWVSLTLDLGYLFTVAPESTALLLLTLDEGYLLTAAYPDLEGGVAPLGPPAPKRTSSFSVH